MERNDGRNRTRRNFLRSVTLSVAATTGCMTSQTPDTAAGKSEWAVFHGDSARTGCESQAKGPVTDLTEKWSYETGDSLWGSPVTKSDTVFIGSYDQHLHAFSADTGENVWSYETGNRIDGTPAVHDGTIYFGSFDRNIYALDASSGDVEWIYETEGYVRSSPVVVDDVLYIGGNCLNVRCEWDYPDLGLNHGNVYAIDAGTGDLLWRYETEGGVMSSPAIRGDDLYIGSSDGKVYALDTETGDETWTYETGNEMVLSAPAISDGSIYVGDFDFDPEKNGKIHAIDSDTGNKEWVYETDSYYISSSPAVCNETVYIGGALAAGEETREGSDEPVQRGKMYARSTDTGEERWTYITDSLEVGSSPAVVGDAVYFGTHYSGDVEYPSGVYALDRETGEEFWHYEIPQRGVGSSPAVAAGTIYFGGENGRIYALE